MHPKSLDWTIFHSLRFLIDAILLIVFIVIHTLATWGTFEKKPVPGESKDVDASAGGAAQIRIAAAARVASAATVGVTVVGVLAPLTLIAIQLRGGNSNVRLPPAALSDLFVSNVWLIASLSLGLLNIYTVAFRGYGRSVLDYRPIKLALGYQLIFLFVGMLRFAWGVWDLSSHIVRVG